MYKVKSFLEGFIVVLSTLVIFVVLTVVTLLLVSFPILISCFTGNWWYMCLYFIMPVVLPAAIFLLQFFIALYETFYK